MNSEASDTKALDKLTIKHLSLSVSNTEVEMALQEKKVTQVELRHC